MKRRTLHRDRVILHCDCNSFFASVETALNPEYRGVPMAVCGSEEERRGIVLAKNDLAKSYGIKTADTVYSARKLCPQLVVVKPHYDEYVNFSSRVSAIYADYTELVEPFGIDESWLDVTASERLFGGGVDIAEQIRARVKREVGITVSIGVSFNKVFAKLGSDYKKPDAVTVINRDNYQEIVYPLSVSDMIFVGNKTVDVLASFGVHTIGELARAPRELLYDKLGKYGEMLSDYASGDDSSEVTPPDEDSKSIGNGYTFRRDLISFEEMRCGVDFLAEEIAQKLRERELLCESVSVSLKDEYMRVVQRQRHTSSPTDICREISASAMEIIKSLWSAGRPVRSITVTAMNLMKKSSVVDQIDVFSLYEDEGREERERLRRGEIAVDDIRRRYGADSIVRGASMDRDMGIYDRKSSKS